ncbi:unnamed protein product [Tilletia controversa]|nr:unnamed protein product [Tilletia controversa]CAD6973328.1 unnamed protein product [Tilletia controversa]CAD6985980.1 unnamed protein product [Tilletia controversa]
MSRPRVTLYLDVVSPYTRVAFEVLKRYEEPWDIELVFKAVSLRAVMDECGNHGPTMGISQKRNQTIKDVSRATQYYDVTLNSPPSFPFPTRPAQLLLRHLSDHPSPSVQAKYVKAIEACFTATWTTHAPLGNAEQVQSAVSSVWGQDRQDELKKLIEESSTPEMVERQEREGKALVNEGGAYGFPWMTVEKDGTTSTWFGSDRFDVRSSQMAVVLGKEWKGPFPDGRPRQIKVAHEVRRARSRV